MKQYFMPKQKLADYLVVAVLILVPFHAFLTVWGSTLVGHYTLLRLWDEVALLALLGIACYYLARDSGLRQWLMSSLLVRVVGAYVGLVILLGFVSLVKGDVTPKALTYGVLVDTRFLVWFLAVLLVAQRSPWLRRNWVRLLLAPAAVVVLFAIIQYTVLPHYFLAHFGYDANTTIAPIETINHNSHYIRAQSTLRGANPLGAYLVLVLSALGVLFTRSVRKVVWAAFGVAALFALYASGSRSAWIGVIAGLAIVAWFQLKTRRGRMLFGAVAAAVLVLAAGGFLLLRGNVGLQNALLHTQAHSAVKISSNGAHASALRNGVGDVLRQPFGDGPGTAGPASVYNGDHPARIAEDYYIQVAQETGWLGLALFLTIFALVAAELYNRIGTSRLALALFAAFVGVAIVNVLSHAWTDDTLAYLWWGLAGIAVAVPPKAKENEGV